MFLIISSEYILPKTIITIKKDINKIKEKYIKD